MFPKRIQELGLGVRFPQRKGNRHRVFLDSKKGRYRLKVTEIEFPRMIMEVGLEVGIGIYVGSL